MTTQRVLIAYGSKNGSTAEIAQWIGDVLREQHIDADTRPAADVRDITPYDAVVLGAGLYAGRWQRDAATERDIPAPPAVARIAIRSDARGHITFGGRLAEDAQGFVARQLIKHGKGGDFRDRDQVRAWARGLAAELARAPEYH